MGISKCIPRPVRVVLKVARNTAYDFYRFVRYSGVFEKNNDVEYMEAVVNMDFHSVEKGLSMPNRRAGFGENVISKLFTSVSKIERISKTSEVAIWARDSLIEYEILNNDNNIENEKLSEFVEQCIPSISEQKGGTIRIDVEEITKHSNIDFESFANSRHSVRHFSNKNIDTNIVRDCVKASLKTPSVCNRQTVKVNYYTNKDLMNELLDIQGGNRGFGHLAGGLIIVTSDLRNFLTEAERYQPWIDGGLFAMSLVYALHSKGLGACMLNWSMVPSQDLAARKIAKVNVAENIIMMIAIGHIEDRSLVAASPRRSVESVFKVH